jgi:hypothetical protein
VTSTSSSSTGGTPATPPTWHEEIVAAFRLRIDRQIAGYEVVTIKVDEEYLRYFDRVLEEMSVADDRLPHPRNPDRTLLRSAAAEVILETFIAGREAEGDPSRDHGGIDSAMTGDLYNVLGDGLVRRMDPARRHRLVTVDLLFQPDVPARLDDELRRIGSALMHEDAEVYLADGFNDFRASFIQACLVTWMVLQELVAEEAIPARQTFALLDAQEQASRRRRLLRLA